MWANHSGRSPKITEWANRSFFLSDSSHYSLIFSQKTSDSLRKPTSEFPNLSFRSQHASFAASTFPVTLCLHILRQCTDSSAGLTTEPSWLDDRQPPLPPMIVEPAASHCHAARWLATCWPITGWAGWRSLNSCPWRRQHHHRHRPVSRWSQLMLKSWRRQERARWSKIIVTILTFGQCCGAEAGRSRTLLLELEPGCCCEA